MTQTVHLPLWLFILILLFAAVTALSHFLLPSVRWFFRRRFERAVKKLNTKLTRPIEPFKLARRHDMIQRLIYDPEVGREIINYAKANKVPENVAFQKAQAYAREIVPSFSAFAYFSFGTRVAKLLARSVYRVKTAPTNEKIFSSIAPEATVIFIMNHRSNMDYVLVTYLAARSSALSYAVGEWARVWPLSFLIRSMGAYFIRRRSRGALYRKVLARYVEMSTAGGVTQAIFPEGGLSLDGAIQPPRLGLLSYVVEGFDADGPRDVVFVPVAINYDRVLEDRVLIAAHARGDRRFGARISVVVGFILRKLWERMRGHDTRFGAAAVAFGAPMSLREAPDRSDVNALSVELIERIKAAMPVLGVPLVCTALRRKGPLSHEALESEVDALLAEVPASNVAMETEPPGAAITRACRHMTQHGLISERDGKWIVQEGQQSAVSYYANSIAHFLPNHLGIEESVAATAKGNAATAGS